MPARSGVCGEVVAVQRQPDSLQPDDQHELQAAAGDRAHQARHVARRVGADAEQAQPEHRLGDLRLDQAEDDQQATPAARPPSTRGLVQPVGWPP